MSWPILIVEGEDYLTVDEYFTGDEYIGGGNNMKTPNKSLRSTNATSNYGFSDLPSVLYSLE